MIASILKEVNLYLIATHTTKGNHFTDDLYQELYLSLLEDKEKVIGLYERKELEPYLYRMAWISYNGRLGQFFLKYRKRHEIIEETQGHEIKLKDVVSEANLSHIERMMLDVYLQHDCNKTWMESNTKICRRVITKHIKEITIKCKNSL